MSSDYDLDSLVKLEVKLDDHIDHLSVSRFETHLYGRIRFADPDMREQDVMYHMSEEQAKALTEADCGGFAWHQGDVTGRFFSASRLYATAEQQWLDSGSNALFLVIGNAAFPEPKIVVSSRVGASNWDHFALNQMVVEYLKVPSVCPVPDGFPEQRSKQIDSMERYLYHQWMTELIEWMESA